MPGDTGAIPDGPPRVLVLGPEGMDAHRVNVSSGFSEADDIRDYTDAEGDGWNLVAVGESKVGRRGHFCEC